MSAPDRVKSLLKQADVSTYRDNPRYRFTFAFFRIILSPISWLLFNFKPMKYPENPDETYLIISNHNGALDPLFLSQSFSRPIFFVASDHIMRMGIISRLLDFLVAPIPIVKSRVDLRALRDIKRELDAGNTVALFPSGNRSVSGPEEKIPKATSKLLKTLKKTVLLYRLEGGYLSSARWARSHRRGKMSGSVVRELSVSELEKLTNAEIDQILREYLDANPYNTDKKNSIKFHGRNLAEYLERIFWHCPSCKALCSLSSKKDVLSCNCGFRLRYDSHGYFIAAGNSAQDKHWAELFPNPDRFYRWQLDSLKKDFSLKKLHQMKADTTIFSDTGETLILTSRANKNRTILRGKISLYADYLEYYDSRRAKAYRFPLTAIHDIGCIGPQRLQFTDSRDQNVYESINKKPRSAYKYIETILQIKSQLSSLML